MRERLAGENGQTYVEWLGGMAVMLVVIVAIFAHNPRLGHTLSCQAGAQVDRILSIDQEGSCDEGGRGRVKRDEAKAKRDAQDRADRRAVRGSRNPGR